MLHGEHEVKTVLVMDKATFKNTEVDYEAYYLILRFGRRTVYG